MKHVVKEARGLITPRNMKRIQDLVERFDGCLECWHVAGLTSDQAGHYRWRLVVPKHKDKIHIRAMNAALRTAGYNPDDLPAFRRGETFEDRLDEVREIAGLTDPVEDMFG